MCGNINIYEISPEPGSACQRQVFSSELKEKTETHRQEECKQKPIRKQIN